MSANGNSEKHFKEEDESFKIQDRAECHSQERKKNCGDKEVKYDKRKQEKLKQIKQDKEQFNYQLG